jgi:2-polyprenyl-3-methyl-5-hydroxy-6-metoxy-1,4-benzoquinol methylase
MLIARCLCGAEIGTVETHNEVRVIRCACGVARLLTLANASEYEQWYESGEYHEATSRHPDCVPYVERYQHDLRVANLRVARYRRVLNGEWRDGMRALDVGCANGAFVDYLNAFGVESYGIDPHPLQTGKSFAGTTAKMPDSLSDLRFDLITYHDVLEHLVDPMRELDRARALMNPSGTLIVDVPDVRHPDGQHHFKAEHFWYLTPTALAKLLFCSGFEPFALDVPIPGKMVAYGRAK